MSVAVPEPIPLDPPPGEPEALDHLAGGLTTAAFCLGVVGASLRGPAGAAPDWHGDDATAAAARVGTVTVLADDVAGALRTAAYRLARHRECLLEVRGRIRALVAQQDEDVAVTWGRLGELPDAAFALRAGAPAATAIVEEFQAAEAARGREHAALLAEVADDAAATARVLADCSHVLGGSGRAGDEGRVVAHLALVLPGWGNAELSARGAELAHQLLGMPTPEEHEALAHEAAAYAGVPVFASALLAGIGVEGMRAALLLLGDGGVPSDGALAALLASAMGAAHRSSGPRDPVGIVLDAVYLDPQDPSSNPDVIALGMGAVIVAGLGVRSGGPPPATVLAWGRQMLAREQAQGGSAPGGRAVDRAEAPWLEERADPLEAVARSLATADDPAFAAELLGDAEAWEPLLARSWDDGGAAFAALVDRAGEDAGPAGSSAVLAGLTALGHGLDDGNPADWTVRRGTAASVAPALGQAVAAHIAVAVDTLWIAVDDSRCPVLPDALRGLGYLTLDRGAAGVIGSALTDWTHAQPVPAGEPGAGPAFPGVAVLAGFVAVQEYAQRLAYALQGYELQAEAERTARLWDLTIGLAAELAPGPWGRLAGVAEGYAALALGMDGTWNNGPDEGLVLDRQDAVEATRAALPPEAGTAVAWAVSEAGAGYDRVLVALGEARPPRSPETDWFAPIVDAFIPGPTDVKPMAGQLRSRPSAPPTP